MARRCGTTKGFGALFKMVRLGGAFNWPPRSVRGDFWRGLREHVRTYPDGEQTSWGIPFEMGEGKGARAMLVAKGRPEVTVKVNATADFVCVLHEWRQLPGDTRREDPHEGLVVAEHVLTYADGATAAVPVRARFEVAMAESPGPPWLAVSFRMPRATDPVNHPKEMNWGHAQTGVGWGGGVPLLCALPNPHPDRKIRSIAIRGLTVSPYVVAGMTLYCGASHPLRHLPRRTYRVVAGKKPPTVKGAEVNLGGVTRIEHTDGARGKAWLASPHAGLHQAKEPAEGAENLVEAFGAEDATVSVQVEGRRQPLHFSLGTAFHSGKAPAQSGKARLEALGRKRQWMQVRVLDAATGEPTPARIHISGSRGEYIAPYGHHAVVNPGWFMDYGADVIAGGRQYAYVNGEFSTDLPVGDLYVEIVKGFEYQPTRTKVSVKPGQRVLELTIGRVADWRSQGWVTADTHVHFISPHTAWLQGQAEGVNVVNLLASQWGRLFTNVGDITGRVGVVEGDTVVYVGTENRNHMLGHISMLGTQGQPVYPMCCGGPGESWLGDPDFRTLAEWALENRRKGGVVIRPHFPFCGHTEDPVPILKGLVDALEIRDLRGTDFPTQEWYRYLNCGYRVAVCGGTDKMGAYCALGWMRTYALLDANRPFGYDAWADAVRAGRTFSTTGPLLDMTVEGRRIGETIALRPTGGSIEVSAIAESAWPLGQLEIVVNGRVVDGTIRKRGARRLRITTRVPISRSGWIAARCQGLEGHPGGYIAAHTSPVYLQVGDTRAFDGPAAEHMLALVSGGIEYLQTLSTAFDEPSRKRMVKLFKEAQAELEGRLLVEADHPPHHGRGTYHTHGHGREADHSH